MNVTKKIPLARNVTALALCGLLPATATVAEAAFAKLDGRTLQPTIEKAADPGLELIDPGAKITPIPLPMPFPPPAPAVAVALTSGGKTLRVIGNGAANDVTIAIDDNGADLVHVYDGNTLLGSYTSHSMTRIQILLKGGDDTFFVGLEPGSSHKFDKKIDLKLGSGNDSGFVDFRGTTSNAIVQGSLDVSVIGGSGDDEVFAHFARKHGGKLAFRCKMGSGADDCAASMWGDISGGADVSFDLGGGSGDDNLWSWNTYDQKDGAYGDIRITADSTFVIRMDGSTGDDQITPTYAGETDGSLTLTVKGRGGADSSFGIVNLAGSSAGKVKARTFGHGGDDDLRLDVVGTSPHLSASINGGQGSDTCQGTANVSKTSCP